MINRTKQRQELLSKLKPNSSVVSSSTASSTTTHADNVKQVMTSDVRKTVCLLLLFVFYTFCLGIYFFKESVFFFRFC